MQTFLWLLAFILVYTGVESIFHSSKINEGPQTSNRLGNRFNGFLYVFVQSIIHSILARYMVQF